MKEATKETKYKMKKRTSTATSSAAGSQIDDATAIRSLEFMKNAVVSQEEILTRITPFLTHKRGDSFTTYKNLYAHRHRNALQNAENVIKDYGNILSFFPELISYDFDEIYGPLDVAPWLENQAGRINELYDTLSAEKKKKIAPIIDELCDTVQMVLKLHALFPPVNTDRTGQKACLSRALDSFVHFADISNATTEEIIAEVNVTTLQPQLIAVGGNKKSISKFYVELEQFLIPLSPNFFFSLNALFKIHFTFNLKYRAMSYNFLKFLEHIIFQIDQEKITSTTVINVAAAFADNND
ncbi:hypothetical protein DMENIID0001_062140 [Sergentomyia squamirostris]